MRFGLQLWPQSTDWPGFRDAALAAEANGWDSVWTWDHLLAIFGPWEQPILEGWAVMHALGPITTRLRLGLMVGANTFRNPGLTAKLATTLDHVSDGRAVLGIGGAWFEREHDAFGIDFGASVGERLDWLDESVGLMRRLLDGERFSHDGPTYTFHDALNAPRPIQDHLPILIGGGGRRKTLRTVASYADGWNISGTVEDVSGALAALEAHAADVGRDLATLEKTVSFPIVLDDDTNRARTRMDSLMTANGITTMGAGPHLTGSPADIAAAIRPYRDLGFETVIVRMPAPYDAQTIERIGEVADLPGEMKVVELAGGVGGAKLAEGLAAHLGADLTVVVNTGDDLELHGLAIWPDHDTVAYTLAGLDDEVRGWGLRDETWTVMDRLASLGDEPWFRLGDRDLATHVWRTDRLRTGSRPTDVALALRAAMGIAPMILPMADEPVRTEVRTDEGWLEFQEYFVHRHQAPTVHEVRFRGIESARPTREVVAAIAAADAIVIAPSNPIVSIGPLLAVPGLESAVVEARGRDVPVIAMSGIVGGVALKGPADRMLTSLGFESSALGVAALYRDLATIFIADAVDAEALPAIEALGLRAVAFDTIMSDDGARARVAGDVLRLLRGGTA